MLLCSFFELVYIQFSEYVSPVKSNYMPYTFKDKCNISNIMEYLSTNDLGRAIAVYKFYDMSNSYNAAEFLFEEAQKQTDIYKKFYFLKEAIIGFNSCYDYPLQIIYFAFDFFEKITSNDEYKEVLKDKCKIYKGTVFSKDIELLKQTVGSAKDFFEKFDRYKDFVSNEDNGIRKWANNIKHQGGFVASDILKHDKVAYVECLQDDLLTFTTEWLYPYTPTFKEIINRLARQKDNLTVFMDWLCESIFGNTKIIDFKSKPKRFSAGKCSQDIKFSMITSKITTQ